VTISAACTERRAKTYIGKLPIRAMSDHSKSARYSGGIWCQAFYQAPRFFDMTADNYVFVRTAAEHAAMANTKPVKELTAKEKTLASVCCANNVFVMFC